MKRDKIDFKKFVKDQGLILFIFITIVMSLLIIRKVHTETLFSEMKLLAEIYIDRDLKSDEIDTLEKGWSKRTTIDEKVFGSIIKCVNEEKEKSEKIGEWRTKKENIKRECFADGFRKLPKELQKEALSTPFLKSFISVLERGRKINEKTTKEKVK